MREQSSTLPRRLAAIALPAIAMLLSACDRAVLNPAGDVALQQRDIIYISTALMLLIIIPVMALIVVFAWRYREGNKDATYDPHFDHSTSLELVIWSAPLLIIICLGALTWWSTHLLDPFRPLNRVSATKPIDAKVQPLTVQVVSLDWKWLFIYPEQGIATVNELALPVDRPVRFDLTSTNMMNTFYVPTMAGMIYVMPAMRSTLYGIMNRPGAFRGMSANYSGKGFSSMRFAVHSVDQAGFDAWVGRVKTSGMALDTASFIALEKPSEKVPAMYFGSVDTTLFDRAYNRCVRPGTPCMSDVMRHDQQSGGGRPHDMRAGSGMPGRSSQPQHGEQPKGALFKEGDEKGTAPHLTKPPAPDTPGTTQPASQKNRDMSLLPAMPGAPRAGAA